jgi:hypothetical protein
MSAALLVPGFFTALEGILAFYGSLSAAGEVFAGVGAIKIQ